MEKKYIFIKPYTTEQGTIPEGSDIIFFRGRVFINGGMCHPAYESILRNIVEDDALHKEYLKDFKIEKNEF